MNMTLKKLLLVLTLFGLLVLLYHNSCVYSWTLMDGKMRRPHSTVGRLPDLDLGHVTYAMTHHIRESWIRNSTVQPLATDSDNDRPTTSLGFLLPTAKNDNSTLTAKYYANSDTQKASGIKITSKLDRAVLGGSEKGGSSGPFVHVSEVPVVEIAGADCDALFRGVVQAEVAARQYQKTHQRESFLSLKSLSNCTEFRAQRQYLMKPVNAEEAAFLLAYSILVYKDVEQVERLLRSIYRPQNYYVIHVDSKSPKQVKTELAALAACFPNVALASRSLSVQWGLISQLQAEIQCMRDLWQYPWKYLINLTGQEFPLRTNLELVRILKTFNGANAVASALVTEKTNDISRTQYHFKKHRKTLRKKPPNPLDLQIMKGATHVVVQRGFVDFVLHDHRSRTFLNWLADTDFPEETFFATLNANPQLAIPGSYSGNVSSRSDSVPVRYKVWDTSHKTCRGMYVRHICILGLGDLKHLRKSYAFFANKFFYTYQPLAYDCLEQRHFNSTRRDAQGQTHTNLRYYRQLPLVKHHL